MLQNISRDVTDERFRTAVVLGIASIPFTAGVNWVLTPDPVQAGPLFVACVISGYLYGPRPVSGTRAGVLTGFIGGIPIIVWNSWMALTDSWWDPIVTDVVSNSVMMAAASVGAALLTVAIMLVVLLVVGWIGGVVGGWMNDRVDSARLFDSKT